MSDRLSYTRLMVMLTFGSCKTAAVEGQEPVVEHMHHGLMLCAWKEGQPWNDAEQRDVVQHSTDVLVAH